MGPTDGNPVVDIDSLVKKVIASEATYNGDVSNVATIKSNIQTATAPLQPAQATLSTDAATYSQDLKDLSVAAAALADQVLAAVTAVPVNPTP